MNILKEIILLLTLMGLAVVLSGFLGYLGGWSAESMQVAAMAFFMSLYGSIPGMPFRRFDD